MPTSPAPHDVAIIGGGVVGCALARAFTLAGRKTVLLERAADVLDGASKANSAILHTGFDAPPGTLESELVARGHAAYRAIHVRLGLPLIDCGALVLAWTPEEEARLPALIETARANGVGGLTLLDRAALLDLEPGLSPSVRAGFRVPGEAIVDAWSAPHAYLAQAVANGATVRTGCEVTGGAFDGRWRLETTTGPVMAGVVINAAGLYGDRLDELLLGERCFEIRPRKGQFVLFDKPAASLASHILLPVPTATTKGVVVCRTAYGNLLVGPTAEEQPERDRADLTPEALEALRDRGAEILPGLAGEEVTAVYAGLRPATESKDYRLIARPDRHHVTVGGIRSTGLSAALGLADHVRDLCDAWPDLPAREPLMDPIWPAMPIISEAGPRDWQTPGNGGIVCHCEMVTRREIEAALDDPLVPPRSLAGLKRRTRVTMGRCQGFYCGATLARITDGRFGERVEPDRLGTPVDG